MRCKALGATPLLGVLALLLHVCSGVIVVLNNGTKLEVDSVYSTLGVTFDTDLFVNVTIVYKNNIDCDFKDNIPLSLIKGRFLVYADNTDEHDLFYKCTNYYFDSYGNAAYFARFAQRAGAIGVLISRAPLNEEYNGWRLSGFNSDIDIPVIVASNGKIDTIVDQIDNMAYLQIPAISHHDKNYIKSIQRTYKGLHIINCILWPILTVLTAYFTYVDFMIYLQMDKSTRTIHPTLTKAAPFVSALFASIWMITDPFSFKLLVNFPATFFERVHFGFIFITSCLLLKTWILAVGDKLKSPQVFRISIIAVNVLTALDVLVTILWVGIGWAFRIVPQAFGGITAVICGIGFIYFGKDIVIILSKQQTKPSGQHKHLSMKIIVFAITFVLFTYTCLIIYVDAVIGSMLSEFLMQFLLALAFITIYAVLFLRKLQRVHTPSSQGSSLQRSKSNNSNKSSSSLSLSVDLEPQYEAKVESPSLELPGIGATKESTQNVDNV